MATPRSPITPLYLPSPGAVAEGRFQGFPSPRAFGSLGTGYFTTEVSAAGPAAGPAMDAEALQVRPQLWHSSRLP